MKRIILAALFFGVSVLLSPASRACFAITPGPLQAFEKSEVVFVGEIAEIIPARVDIYTLPFEERFNYPMLDTLNTIRFKVEKSLKGAATTEVKILAYRSISRCLPEQISYTFHKGEKYLVYAVPLFHDKEQLSVVWLGNRTAPLSESAKDIRTIEAEQRKKLRRPPHSRKRAGS